MLKKVLKKINYVLVDTEGTVSLGGEPIGNMAQTLDKIRNSGKQIIFLINNSSMSVKEWENKYRAMGLYDERDVYYTASAVTIDYIKMRYLGKRCFVLGTPSVVEEFKEAGITISEDDAEIAVLTQDTTLTFDKLVKFISALKHGAIYIATHHNAHKHVGDIKVPDVGALIKMIECACGEKPVITVGKPSPVMGENVMKYFCCNADEILLVGDRLKTDIQFGINGGFYTMLVLSGKADEKSVKGSDVVPDFILPTLNDIVPYLED